MKKNHDSFPNQNISSTNTVAKSNELVQACYKLTLDEQRLMLCAISKIKMGQSPGKITVTAKDFADAYGLNAKLASTQMNSAAHRLYERDIKIKGKWRDEHDGLETRMRWLQRITVETWSGQVELYFNTELQKLIFQLKGNFTKYNQKYVSNLTSTYAIRLYELLQQYLKFGERRFELQEIRELLGLEGRYALWADLKNG